MLLEGFDHFEREIDRQAESDEQRLFWKIFLNSGRHVSRARIAWYQESKQATRRHQRRQAGATRAEPDGDSRKNSDSKEP